MTKVRVFKNSWVQSGMKAAEKGDRGEALAATITLVSLLFSAIDTIIDNQFEIYAAINKPAPAAPAAVNGRKP